MPEVQTWDADVGLPKSISLDRGLNKVGRFTLLGCDSYVKSPTSRRVKFTVSERILRIESFSKVEICGDTDSAGAVETMNEINSALQADDPDYATLARKRHDRLKGFRKRWRAQKVFLALAQLVADRKAEARQSELNAADEQDEALDSELKTVQKDDEAPTTVQVSFAEVWLDPKDVDAASEVSIFSLLEERPTEDRDHNEPVDALELSAAAMEPSLWRLSLRYQPLATGSGRDVKSAVTCTRNPWAARSFRPEWNFCG
eukprot:4021997-Pyramimonas_sp.AAC.2